MKRLLVLAVGHGFALRSGLALLAAFSATALIGPWCAAQGDDEAPAVRDHLEEEHALPMGLVTPHTKWAKPYTQGRVKAVFFAPWFQGSTDAREIIELMQRFDLDAAAVYLMGGRLVGDGNPGWYGGDPEAGTKRALRLLDQPNDAIFLNQVLPAMLPEPVREKLEHRVKDGMGLVVVGEESGPPLAGAVAMTAGLGQGSDGIAVPGATCYRAGQGRIVCLPKRPPLAFQEGWEVELDYQLAQQGRALLWAAGKEPAVSLELRMSAASIQRNALPGVPAALVCTNAPKDTQFRVRIRREDGWMQPVTRSGEGEAAGKVEFPVLRAGSYRLDAFALSGDAVANWASVRFEVKAGRQVEAVTLDRDWAEIGENLTGQAQLAGETQTGEVLEIRLVDPRGRIVAREELAQPGATVPFEFAVQPWMPMLLKVQAVLSDTRGEVASAYRYARVTKRSRDRFNFVMWNVPNGGLAPYGIRSLAQNGVTAVLQGGEPPLAMAANELAFVPYAASFRASSHTVTAMLNPETGFLKTGCVHDRAGMAQTVAEAAKRHEPSRQHGVLAYSLGDENAVRASCLSPHCLEAYRAYLKQVYGDIQSLNRSWESDYAGFDAIELLSQGPLPAPDAPEWFAEYYAERQRLHRTDSHLAEGAAGEHQMAFGDVNDEMRALQEENFARWYDRQAFQSHTYVQWCKEYRRAFAELDPHAWTGFEGTDSFTIRRLTTRTRQGGDLDAFVRELDYFGPYGGPANEVVRSIAPPGFPMGNWMGYKPDAETLLHGYWSQITDQMNTVQWWRWDNLNGYHGYLAPNLEPFPAVRELLEDTQVVRDGLGDWLMGARMQDDGVAMLYSMPSTHIAHFDGNRSYGHYERGHGIWHEFIHGAGLQFRYVTDRMLRRGEFDVDAYKVLILPLAFALSEEEAAVIHRFVESGGMVIADVRPATYTGRCKKREQGLLDGLFGVKRTGGREARKIDRMYVDGELNGRQMEMRWGNWHGKDIYPQMTVDPNVETTTGKALGEAYHIHFWAGLNSPMCVVNEAGKGRAVLLNFPVYHAPAAGLVAELLAAAGVERRIDVTLPDGSPAREVEVTRWQDGTEEVVALFGRYTGQAQVRIPEPRFVYNLKTGENLGETTQFSIKLRANRAVFFALLPGPGAAPSLALTANEVAPGEEVHCSVEAPGASGRRPFAVKVSAPDGVSAPWFERNIIAGSAPVRFSLPFAYNDPRGDWTIHVSDVLTKEAATATVHLD